LIGIEVELIAAIRSVGAFEEAGKILISMPPRTKKLLTEFVI